MRILHVAAEIHPVVRTGGLGDVVAALPAAQQALGHDVRLILPAYPALKAALDGQVVVAMLRDRFDAPVIRLLRGRLNSSGLVIYLIDAPSLFDRPGNPYPDLPMGATGRIMRSVSACSAGRRLPWRAGSLMSIGPRMRCMPMIGMRVWPLPMCG